jgi:hypothetical protein
VIKHPNSNVDFVVGPGFFLGDFDVYDREESLGQRLERFNPNDSAQLRSLMDEFFFKGARVSGLNALHKAELVRVLADALANKDFDFRELIAPEGDFGDCFALPESWNIVNPRALFLDIYELTIQRWEDQLHSVGLIPTTVNDLR